MYRFIQLIVLLNFSSQVLAYLARVNFQITDFDTRDLCDKCRVTFQFFYSDGHPCPVHWEHFHNSCYKFNNRLQTYPKAESYCYNTENARLVTVNNAEEADFVSNFSQKNPNSRNGRVWVGLQQKSVSAGVKTNIGRYWIWHDERSTYFKWKKGGHDVGKCGEFILRGREISPQPCNRGWQSVCEKEADVNYIDFLRESLNGGKVEQLTPNFGVIFEIHRYPDKLRVWFDLDITSTVSVKLNTSRTPMFDPSRVVAVDSSKAHATSVCVESLLCVEKDGNKHMFNVKTRMEIVCMDEECRQKHKNDPFDPYEQCLKTMTLHECSHL